MSEGIKAMTAPVRRRLPEPVKRSLWRGYRITRRGVHAAAAQVDLARIKRDYRERYGPDLIYTVDQRDEMYQFVREFWAWPFHVVPMRAPSYAMRTYLASGDLMMRDLEGVLQDQGRALADVDSFLEFASGYGRFTRFLVTRVDHRKVTVSDISRPAVDFARATFGVSGFYSAESAAEVDHDQQHQVVFIASLFSHLTIDHWNEWLKRLYEMVAPGGLLIFSTHGPHARDVIYDDDARSRLEMKADGFEYLLTNETHGRLAAEYYGSAFVTEAYVKARVDEHGLGTVKRVYPAKLWGSQDVYVIEKPRPRG